MNTLTLSLGLAAFAVLAGCGEVVPENQGNGPPVVMPTNDAGVTPIGDAGDDAATVTPKRVVEARNPFGNLDPTNLVLDGDFEFSGRQGQMPWLSFAQTQGTLDFETGGRCASGTRCAKLGKDTVLFGWMVSPKAGNSIEITLKTRILVGTPKNDESALPCPEPKLSVYVIDIDNTDSLQRLRIDNDVPPVNGFCTYHGVVDAMPLASPGIYVESAITAAKDVILLDAVYAKEVPPNTAHAHQAKVDLSAASKARMHSVVEWIRRHRFGGERPAQPIK